MTRVRVSDAEKRSVEETAANIFESHQKEAVAEIATCSLLLIFLPSIFMELKEIATSDAKAWENESTESVFCF